MSGHPEGWWGEVEMEWELHLDEWGSGRIVGGGRDGAGTPLG